MSWMDWGGKILGTCICCLLADDIYKLFEEHLKLVFFCRLTSRSNILKVIQLKDNLLFLLQTILIVKVYEL